MGPRPVQLTPVANSARELLGAGLCGRPVATRIAQHPLMLEFDGHCAMQIHYDDEAHADAFIRLNEAWISEHFEIEAGDRALARDPMRIVREGGSLITLADEGRVVGTCALVKEGRDRYQLARMTVAAALRGNGWGHALVGLALERARSLGASSVYLLSNTRLAAAIHLYHRYGFEVVRQGPHPQYARCDIVMELHLPR